MIRIKLENVNIYVREDRKTIHRRCIPIHLLYKKDSLCDILNMANEPYIELPFETSAENMAMHIYNQIKTYLPIVKIELAETKSSNVIYETIN
jgi:6-pyruvoyl-tetrahydropterin synthase